MRTMVAVLALQRVSPVPEVWHAVCKGRKKARKEKHTRIPNSELQ